MEKRQIFIARTVKLDEEDKYIVTCGNLMYIEGDNPEKTTFESPEEAQACANTLNGIYNWDAIGTFVMAVVKAEIEQLKK